ncbi:MAG: N-acetyltransferase [Acidobacteriota bacterium]|nr:N-acetyltransferase [Acidobacteriota bacterium]
MFTIRDYQKRDFDVLFKLDRLCFEPGIAYSRPELASFIEQRRAYTIVAEWTDDPPADGVEEDPDKKGPALTHPHIAGFLTFHFQKQEYGHIITLDVHPDVRRQRLGTQLMAAACEKMRKLTAFMAVLEVAVNNHSALAFYERHGFKKVKVLERYYNRDVDAIFMTKRL